MDHIHIFQGMFDTTGISVKTILTGSDRYSVQFNKMIEVQLWINTHLLILV